MLLLTGLLDESRDKMKDYSLAPFENGFQKVRALSTMIWEGGRGVHTGLNSQIFGSKPIVKLYRRIPFNCNPCLQLDSVHHPLFSMYWYVKGFNFLQMRYFQHELLRILHLKKQFQTNLGF